MKNATITFLRMTKLLLFALLVSAVSCTVGKEAASDNSLMLNCWKHSYEEEIEGGNRIYRPCDYTTFPPSRYRESFTLSENDQSTYSVLAPTDAHYNEEGGWNYDETSQTLTITNADNEMVKKFQVIEMLSDKLVLN